VLDWDGLATASGTAGPGCTTPSCATLSIDTRSNISLGLVIGASSAGASANKRIKLSISIILDYPINQEFVPLEYQVVLQRM
jgi:hypothetical protein